MNDMYLYTRSDTTPIVTIFYSNYSGNCKALLQRINSSNIMDNLNIKYINIDNNVMRDVITKKFSVVPTIVVLLKDEISLYTGDNAFEWFNIFSSSLEEKEIASEISDNTMSKKEEDPSSKTIVELAAEISKAREKF